MALKLVFDNNSYQKIILENSYININGLYVGSIILRDEAERIKDKEREASISQFIQNLDTKRDQLDNDSELSIEEKEIEYNNLNKALYVRNVINDTLYRIGDSERNTVLTEEFIIEAEKYGFNREWYNNPVVIERVSIMWVEPYNQQVFSLESFYNALRNKYQSANLLTEDI